VFRVRRSYRACVLINREETVRRLLLALPLLAAPLCACGTSTPTVDMSVKPAPSATAAPTPDAPVRPDARHVAAGVAAVRKTVPRLVAGRTDKGIGHDVDAVCFDIAAGHPETTATVIRRFTNGSRVPTAAQAGAIVRAIRVTACP